jgi:pyridoxine 5-phosphate synthase
MIKLHVNIDHVATLRQARGTTYPDPVWAAAACELAGAHGITCHLREDRRHILDRDVDLLRQTVRTLLNLEVAATPEMVAIARRVRPDLVTFVPEKRAERTTEGGLEVVTASGGLRDAVGALQGEGIPVSLFVDPVATELRAAAALGVRHVEISTGRYAEQRGDAADAEIEKLALATEEALSLGLHVAAGHGLDYPNVAPVAAIPGIEELNIGHAIIARAIFVGLERAVRDMLALCKAA